MLPTKMVVSGTTRLAAVDHLDKVNAAELQLGRLRDAAAGVTGHRGSLNGVWPAVWSAQCRARV